MLIDAGLVAAGVAGALLYGVQDIKTLNSKPDQQLNIAPSPAENADCTVISDKVTGEPGALKVIERRRISVMIHPT